MLSVQPNHRRKQNKFFGTLLMFRRTLVDRMMKANWFWDNQQSMVRRTGDEHWLIVQ
jgi:hypothetical protein